MKKIYSVICILLGFCLSVSAQTANVLRIPDVTATPGKPSALSVYMDNASEVVGLQFTVNVPQGMRLSEGDIVLDTRGEDHIASIKKIEINNYLCMVYSPTNKPLRGYTGKLFDVNFTIADSFTDGSVHPMALKDVVLGDASANNVMTSYSIGCLRVIDGPDLTVQNIVTQEGRLTPGGTVCVAWTINNDGGMPTTSGWKEQVSLVGDNGKVLLLGTVYNENILSDGGQMSRSATLNLPQTMGLDGNANIQVKVIANADAGESASAAANNTAVSDVAVNVGRQLFIEVPTVGIDENSRSLVKCKLLRSGSWAVAETFTLLKSADDRVDLPATVTISKGQSATYFYIKMIDNEVLDDDSVVTISASGNGYEEVKTQLIVVDNEYPDLTITAPKYEIAEGETFQLLVEAARVSSKPVTLYLTCDRAEHFKYPAQVTLPAGAESVTVDVTAIEDNLPNVTLDAAFTVKATRYNSSECYIELLDNDLPEIALTLTPKTISEAAGPTAVMATLKRLTHKDNKVTVKLTDDSNGRLYYSTQTIVLESGVSEAQFTIGAIDNALVDGEQEITVTAAIYISSCDCAASGTTAGVVAQTIKVLDDDGPSLQLSLSKSMLLEGAEEATVLTVTRNTNTNVPLTVTLTSDADDILTYEKTVTIPAGQASTSLTVAVKANDTSSDSRTVVFAAKADEYTSGTCWAMITDQTLPDAVVTAVSPATSQIVVGDTVEVSVTVGNEGVAPLVAPAKVTLYLSNSSAALATFYTQENLAPGSTITLTKKVAFPTVVGSYKLRAVVNEAQSTKELLYINNTLDNVNITMLPAFTATVATDKKIYKQGEAVNISGVITGKNTANAEVEVYIINSGVRQTLSVTTDATGKFSTMWQPYNGQMGHFVVGACYPKEALKDELASFDIYGLKRTSSSYITCETLVGEPYNGSITLSNPGELPLTGVKVEVLSAPEHCKVITQLQPEIAGGNNATLSYTLTNDAVTSGNDWEEIKLRVTTSEGVSMDITLYHFCRSPKGQLQASVSAINTTMIKGASRDYSFTIVNQGKGATGKISLALPDVAWMKAVTPIEMASLNYGETATVVLRLTPTEDMQLNVPVTGRIGINCENGDGIPLNYRIEPVSESTGTLTVDVCDEYTYYTAEAPHVAGAQVLVKHPVTGAVVAKGLTGEDGKFSVELPEGYYTVSVTADKHSSDIKTILVNPGLESEIIVNLSFRAISVNWEVEETEIEDKYSVVTTVKYETNVPMPIVELSIPKSIPAKDLANGESLIFYATLTNKGLITAKDAELLLPEGFTTLKFEPQIEYSGLTIAPQQSITIPVKVTRTLTVMANGRMQRAKPIDNDPCVGQPGTLYFWDCGEDRKWHRYGIALQLGSCNSNDPSTWDNSGNGNYGGGGGGPWGPTYLPIGGSNSFLNSLNEVRPLTTTEDEGCEPCQNRFIRKLVECGLSFIPVYGCVSGSYDCANGALEGDTGWRHNANCILTGIGCTADLCTGASLSTVVAAPVAAVCEVIGFTTNVISCLISFTEPCDAEAPENSPTYNRAHQKMRAKEPDYITNFRETSSVVLKEMVAYEDILIEFFGDSVWVKNTTIGELNDVLTSIVLSDDTLLKVEDYIVIKPQQISKEQFERFIERINNSEHYAKTGELNNDNYIDNSVIAKCYMQIGEAEQISQERGYNSIDEMWIAESNEFKVKLEEASKSVCASITLQFSQTMTMTRQAFRGTLTVFNGNETTAMEDVKLSLEVRDEYGALATAHEFQINAESLDKFDGELSLESGWSLAANETGVATILFIPTKYAAPTEEKKYSFGGTLSYIDPFTGLEVTRDLYPVTLTVKPSPNLEMTYFMQRDIFGDDPLTTDVVEPMEPAEFSLLINNVGYGDATNVRMVTEQPKIIENEKGLFIDFELLSSQLNGGEQTLALGGSVPTEFGTIPAHSTAYAQWWIQSTLLGHFTEYDIKATHVTSYGNEDLSLLDTVTIHELVRSIKVPAEENTVLTGFLVNDIADAEDMPDMLYLSDGIVESVSITTETTISKNSDTEYLLTVSPLQAGWNYGSLVDPTYGKQDIVRIVRQSDGAEINLRNIWQTDRTLRDGKDPLYESRIHFVDKFGTIEESYLMTFEPKPEKVLEVEKFIGVPANDVVVKDALKEVTMCFNKPIDAATFTTEDLTLHCQGKAQDVSQIVITQVSNTEYKLDISALSAFNGYYVLTVQTAGIVDNEGFAGESGKTASWVQYVGGKVNLMIQVTPDDAGTVTPAAGLYDYEEMLTLTATTNDGYEFLNWSCNDEVIATTPTHKYLMEGDAIITATFAPKNYNVEIVCDVNEGVVTGSGTGVYQYGNVLNLTAEPLSGYKFDGWYITDNKVAESSTYSHTVDSTVQIEARFTQVVYDLTLRLENGWNWISTHFADEELMTSWKFINPIRSSVERLVGQETEVINDPEYGLVGNLKILSATDLYKLKVNRLTLNTWSGPIVDVSTTQISLQRGWNWIGYPSYTAADVSEAFALLKAEEGDYVVGQDGFAEYTDGKWMGTLSALIPGKGYMYHSESDKVFVYNTEVKSKANSRIRVAEETPWTVNKYKYPKVMCVIANLYDNGALTENYYVGAFCGTECRGVGKFLDGKLMISIYGGGNEKISFYAMDNDTEQILNITEIVTFEETLVGSVKRPYSLHVGDATNMSKITIGWNVNLEQNNLYLTANDKAFDYVTLTDVYGNNVLTAENVVQGQAINVAMLPNGIYIVTAKQGDIVYYNKIMKTGK